MSDYYVLFSQTFYGLLFSYLTITDVTPYNCIQFLSCCTSQLKVFKQIITVNSSTNAPITKKITLACFACLCFFRVDDKTHNHCHIVGTRTPYLSRPLIQCCLQTVKAPIRKEFGQTVLSNIEWGKGGVCGPTTFDSDCRCCACANLSC